MKMLLGAGLLLAATAHAQAPEGWVYQLDAPQRLVDTQAVAAGE